MDNGTLLLNDVSYSGGGGTLVMNGKIYGGGGADVSDTTATPGDVSNGKIFYTADGARAVGELVAPKVATGTMSPTTTEQEVTCGFRPTKILFCLHPGGVRYFGFAIYENGTVTGARYYTDGDATADAPVTITITDNGFNVKTTSSRYNYSSNYIALG